MATFESTRSQHALKARNMYNKYIYGHNHTHDVFTGKGKAQSHRRTRNSLTETTLSGILKGIVQNYFTTKYFDIKHISSTFVFGGDN